jgi:hypothetical protein
MLDFAAGIQYRQPISASRVLHFLLIAKKLMVSNADSARKYHLHCNLN